LHGPSGKNVGLGLSIINDKVSVLNETHVFADFSYSVKASENSTLAFGLKAGGSFLDVDLLQLGIEEDPLFAENINQFNPNVGAGVYLYSDKFYASVSTINILDTKRNDLDNSIVSSASDRMVFYMSSGYTFDTGGSIKIRPSVMFRTANGSPSASDLATSLIWNDAIEFGISHRFDVATSALVQFNISDNLKLGYAYDSITSELSDFVGGSHEISLVINWGKGKSNKVIIKESEQEKETTVPEPQVEN
jgi:type IX secretion system PorP/SprF family membrane protein